MSGYSWDWHPSSKAEAETWASLDSSYAVINVVKSEFADESIIKSIALHSWSDEEKYMSVPPALLDFPGITTELIAWLDNVASSWSLPSQHNYWYKRFAIERWNSNHDSTGNDGPTRGFGENVITKICTDEQAAPEVLSMADHFTEQLWHDLAEQGHAELTYSKGYRGDDLLEPSFNSKTSEEILKLFVDAYWLKWLEKNLSLDFEWARERIEDEEGLAHFEDAVFSDLVSDDEPFPEINLGNAIAAGIQEEDLVILDLNKYEGYLEEIYTEAEDPEMYNVELRIISDTPWTGIRYRELSEPQQMNLSSNIVATLKHPYLGRPDGISLHLLQCMAKHNKTADNVKAFILLNLPS